MPGAPTPDPAGRPANRLAREKSPYLLQHAHNPVDWYPWGNEAFDRAEEEKKPIFLSIGYSTCHWCHVMAHECFEDEGVAAILNRNFVSIKVDREERPDIDSVYMEVCQQMTGQGGWPLTIVMTPEKLPFFAGTYFPRDSTPAMPGLADILERIAAVWRDNRDEIARSAEEIGRFAGTLPFLPVAGRPDQRLLEKGYRALAAQFDTKNAGFGNAPKFPAPHILIFLVRYGKLTKNPDAILMAEQTLDAIRWGGIWDHVGGGLHRYATDAGWRIPHFEKMLYDQALFVLACTETYEATGVERFRTMARECIAYVLRDLRDPGGAFYTAEDADSPGGEGAYYAWTKNELDRAGAGSLFSLAPLPGGRRDAGEARFILSRDLPGTDPVLPGPARETLLAIRKKRPRPARDDKILTDINALFCQALARAGRAFHEPEYIRAAEAAMAFLLAHLADEDGTLFHRYRGGERAVQAFADDYAQMIAALAALYEATFDPACLSKALKFARVLREQYEDQKDGGFFTVASGNDELFLRKKEWYDGAYPSANATAFGTLSWLARVTQDPDIAASAEACAGFLAGAADRAPAATAACLAEFERFPGGQDQMDLVIAGDPAAEDTRALIGAARSRYLPRLIILLRPPGSAGEAVDALAPAARGHAVLDGRATAYLCAGHTCRPPVQDPEELQRMLEKIGQ